MPMTDGGATSWTYPRPRAVEQAHGDEQRTARSFLEPFAKEAHTQKCQTFSCHRSSRAGGGKPDDSRDLVVVQPGRRCPTWNRDTSLFTSCFAFLSITRTGTYCKYICTHPPPHSIRYDRYHAGNEASRELPDQVITEGRWKVEGRAGRRRKGPRGEKKVGVEEHARSSTGLTEARRQGVL